MSKKFRTRNRLNTLTGSAHKSYTVLEDVELIDESIASTWNYWAFRCKRILPPNVLLHLSAIISLILNIMQVLVLITLIRQNRGDFSNVNTFLIMLPLYVQFALKVIVQMIGFGMAVENACMKEMDHPIFNLYEELTSAIPVLEHLVPVVTYMVFLVCAVSVGTCHLSSNGTETIAFCNSMKVEVVEALILTATVILVLHNLFGIYTHSKHCSTLKSRSPMNYSNVELRHLPSSSNQLDQVAQELDTAMNWWKFRLQRIFSSNVANNVLRALDHAVEGGLAVKVLRAFHDSKGNLHSVHDWSDVLLPLTLCFFLKFAVVLVMLVYVLVRSIRESKLKILIHLSEPKGWLQVVEYLLPLVTFLTFGLVTLMFGRCMVNTESSSCVAFSWDFTEMIIIVVGLVQFLYHVRAIHNVHTHTTQWKRKEVTEAKSVSSNVPY